jgi:hypothetical protein
MQWGRVRANANRQLLPVLLAGFALGCSDDSTGGVLYELVFSDSAASATLSHNGTATVSLGGQAWDIRVLRAFELFNYDNPVPFTWLATLSTE